MSDNSINKETKQQEDVDGKSSSLSTKTDEQEEVVEVIWDTIVGSHLRFGKETVATIEHIQDNDTKEFILFYFSAKWCPPCQTFTPILIDFYHTINNGSSHNNSDETKKKPNKKKNRIEIIYIPSDRNVNEFEAYYTAKMPWYAIDVVNSSTKKSLAEMFRITSIPTLIVLDAKTGLFVTSDARTDIMKHRNNNIAAIIERWRSIKPVSIEIGLAGPAEPISPWQRFITAIVSNPVYLFLILYMAKNWYQHYMKGKNDAISPAATTGDQHLNPNPHGNNEFDDEF